MIKYFPIFLLFFLCFWGCNSATDETESQELLRQKISKVIISAIPKIKKRWAYGDYDQKYSKNAFSCSKELGVFQQRNSVYLRCNPNYLQCFLSGRTGVTDIYFKTKIDGKYYQVRANPVFRSPARYKRGNRYYKVVSKNSSNQGRVPDYGVMLNLSVKQYPQWSMNIVLHDSCSDSYLPQRIYSYGLKKLQKVKRGSSLSGKKRNPFLQDSFMLPTTDYWRWDNVGEDIYFDKYLVRFRDVVEWIDYGQKGKSSIKIPPVDRWSAPATGLTLEQMHKFCAFRGKKLMEATIYDAATFFVDTNSKMKMETIVPSVYPWSFRSRDSFLFKSRTGKNHFISKDDCQKAFIGECRKRYNYQLDQNSPVSWSGMVESIGGQLEGMRNSVDPKWNLKASSFYFNAGSLWHMLGKRTHWNGTGFSYQDISWKDSVDGKYRGPLKNIESGKIGISFRCMKKMAGER